MNPQEDQSSLENSNESDLNSQDVKYEKEFADIEDKYKFGWSNYSEITNGRFAMVGFLAIILIELFSHKSFLTWAGIF